MGAWVSLAATIGSSVLGNMQKRKESMAQAAQARSQADTAESSARVQAGKIRKAAQEQASEANAAYAGSGVEAGEGSALKITSGIVGKGEHDAMSAIYSGENTARQLRSQAEQAEASAKSGSIIGTTKLATSAILMGSGGPGSGWQTVKTAKKAKNAKTSGFVF